MILGTGVGGGLVINGAVVEGPQKIAGEWGHNPLPSPGDSERPGPECYCGRFGCTETFISGPGLERDYRLETGCEHSSRQISEMAANEDPAAVAAIDRYIERLGRALAVVINIIDPENL